MRNKCPLCGRYSTPYRTNEDNKIRGHHAVTELAALRHHCTITCSSGKDTGCWLRVEAAVFSFHCGHCSKRFSIYMRLWCNVSAAQPRPTHLTRADRRVFACHAKCHSITQAYRYTQRPSARHQTFRLSSMYDCTTYVRTAGQGDNISDELHLATDRQTGQTEGQLDSTSLPSSVVIPPLPSPSSQAAAAASYLVSRDAASAWRRMTTISQWEAGRQVYLQAPPPSN